MRILVLPNPFPIEEPKVAVPKPPLPKKVAGSAPRVITIKRKGAVWQRNAPRSMGEDLVPWVSGEHEDFLDLEEEEREERMTGLLDRYAARKRKQQLSSSSESDPVQTAGPSQAVTEGGSEMQAIVIHGSPEPVPIDQMEPVGVDRIESHDYQPDSECTSGNPPFRSGRGST